MKKALFLTLSLISFQLQAGPILGIGGGMSLEHESDESLNGDPLAEMGGGFGFGFGAEIFPGPLSLNLGLQTFSGDATTQYSRGAVSVSDVDTEAQNTYGLLGPRWRFIYTQSFTSFIGAGPVFGRLAFDYSSIPSGSKSSEAKSYTGYYVEAGMEFIFNANHALRLTAAKTQYETQKFTTLGDKSLNMDYVQVGLVYMLNLGWQ